MKKTKNIRALLSLLLALALAATLSFALLSCGKKPDEDNKDNGTETTDPDNNPDKTDDTADDKTGDNEVSIGDLF